jgi:hypothetical protein
MFLGNKFWVSFNYIKIKKIFPLGCDDELLFLTSAKNVFP